MTTLAAAAAAFAGPTNAPRDARGEIPPPPPPLSVPSPDVPGFTFTSAPAYRIESAAFRFTHFDQTGFGFQSAAGPAFGPGSERVTVEQPQAEVVASLGDRLVERVRLPVDIVTAASPNHRLYNRPADAPLPVDAISAASAVNPAAALEVDSVYRWDRTTHLGFHAAFHIEEPFESWAMGMTLVRSLADDNTVVAGNVRQIVDWFDHFNLAGERYGRGVRSTTNANVAVTQILAPTTVGVASYGATLQSGTLSNTWNSVPLMDGTRGEERVPRDRWRHALGARVAQWLPWDGALKLGYRLYLDSWSVIAHTFEVTLAQRLWEGLTIEARGRVHLQSAVAFFATSFDPAAPGPRTSDSDLEAFTARSLGASVRWERRLGRRHVVFFDVGAERYVRSNDMQVDLVTAGVGWRR